MFTLKKTHILYGFASVLSLFMVNQTNAYDYYVTNNTPFMLNFSIWYHAQANGSDEKYVRPGETREVHGPPAMLGHRIGISLLTDRRPKKDGGIIIVDNRDIEKEFTGYLAQNHSFSIFLVDNAGNNYTEETYELKPLVGKREEQHFFLDVRQSG